MSPNQAGISAWTLNSNLEKFDNPKRQLLDEQLEDRIFREAMQISQKSSLTTTVIQTYVDYNKLQQATVNDSRIKQTTGQYRITVFKYTVGYCRLQKDTVEQITVIDKLDQKTKLQVATT